MLNFTKSISARIWVISLLALAVLTLYGLTMPQSITWGNYGSDSGEFGAVIETLGIPHPPGYPTYTLIGFLWAQLPLGGDTAYRLNWLSAVCATLAVILVVLLTERITRSDGTFILAKIFGGVFLATAPLVWSQSIVTEVYAMGLCFLGLMFLNFSRLLENPVRWRFLTAGLMLGLSFGVLPQILVLAPFVFLAAFRRAFDHQHTAFLASLRAITRSDLGRLSLVALGTLIGLLPFLYLPIRAAANPIYNWGTPNTWNNFWWMLTAAQYHHLAGIPSLGVGIERFFGSMALLLLQIPYWGILLIIFGIFRTWQTRKLFCISLLSLFFSSVFLRVNYFVLNNDVYLIPSVFVMCLFCGIGIAYLYKSLNQPIICYGLLIFLGVSGCWNVVQHLPQVNLRDDRSAVEFAKETLRSLPQDAVVFSDRDETTFSLWYAQAVGQRRDVLIIDTRLLLYSWYQNNLAHHYPEIERNWLRPGAVTGMENPLYRIEGQFPDFVLMPINGHS